MLRGKVIIIIPSQGHSRGSFKHVAMELRAKVYPDAIIVQTTVSGDVGSYRVKLETSEHTAFSWEDAYGVLRVLTISHAAFDGPNLTPGVGGAQPWSVVLDGGKTANEFWGSVGESMVPDGKIILLGCHMGESAYGLVVHQITRTTVYASGDYFAAGEAKVALRHVLAIEDGKVLKPMQEFGD